MINFMTIILLVLVSHNIRAEENTSSISKAWAGDYELLDPNCKTGRYVYDSRIEYGKRLRIKTDSKNASIGFTIITDSGRLAEEELYHKVNIGSTITNSCWSDGLIYRSTITANERNITEKIEKLKPFAFCSKPFRVKDTYVQKIATRDSNGNVYFKNLCWFKKINSQLDENFWSRI